MQSYNRTKYLIAFALMLFLNINIDAQYRYEVKGGFLIGKIYPHCPNLKAIAKDKVKGGEIAFEISADGENEWQQFWRFPNVGIGLGAINLGNDQLLGNVIYAYPYVAIPFVDSRIFGLNLKIGTGISYVTKTWADGDTLNGVNAPTANGAFSSPINCYITAGINTDIKITEQVSLYADIGLSHMSNGSFRNPNFGMNIYQSQMGIRYAFGRMYNRLVYNPAYGLPFDFEGKIVASAFSRQVNFKDHQNYLVGSIHIGMTTPLTDWYAIGGGADIFYDGIFTNRPTEHNPTFTKYLIEEDKITNKIKTGLSLNNELIMGRVTGVIDLGFYLYDPIRNRYADIKEKRGLFYKYDPSIEDGWSYFRLALRYRVYDNFVLQIGVKSHIHKAEMLEVGIGYMLPFYRSKHASISKKMHNYRLYHYDQREAPAYDTPWLR